jgi:hypothetical protein
MQSWAEVSRSRLQTIERELEVPLNWNGSLENTLNLLINSALTDQQFGLDLIDHELHLMTYDNDRHTVIGLIVALYQGGSAWEVHGNDAETKGFHLQRRVDETAQAAANQAFAHGRAGVHLRNAWSEVYGKNPDPSKAYTEAIKAVEVSAGPVVAPKDKLATLGKMIGELKGHPESFTVLLTGTGDSPTAKGDLDAVTITRLMAQLLWTSQHDRHGNFDLDSVISVSQEEAQAAVQLAVLLVQWFETGVMSRVM